AVGAEPGSDAGYAAELTAHARLQQLQTNIPRACIRSGNVDPVQQVLDDELHQLGPVGDMVIRGHGGDAELVGELAHREAVEPDLSGESRRSADDIDTGDRRGAPRTSRRRRTLRTRTLRHPGTVRGQRPQPGRLARRGILVYVTKT